METVHIMCEPVFRFLVNTDAVKGLNFVAICDKLTVICVGTNANYVQKCNTKLSNY
jgi:hypothetical protein